MFFITQTATDAASKAIAEGISAGLTLLGIYLAFALAFLVGVVALITWVVKLVWNGGRKRKKVKYSDDWMYNAQQRQYKKYEYSDPVINQRRATPKKKAHNANNAEPKWYPTGWTYNEETKLWEPPDYLQKD